jgi:hypothetical protein
LPCRAASPAAPDGTAAHPREKLLSRTHPPRSPEASRSRDAPEPGTGHGQTRRLPGQADRRAPVAACGTPPFSSAESSWRTRAVTGKRQRASGAEISDVLGQVSLAGPFSAGGGTRTRTPPRDT